MTTKHAVALADIQRARESLAGAVVRTPLVPARALSDRLGVGLSLKLETLQRTGSFKDRGACNRIAALDDAARQRGVIAASAGNHAQGVACHAGRLGAPATIVMPAFTPFTKVARTESWGAHVVLTGDNIADCQVEVRRIAEAQGLTEIHAYDDPLVIAGQGTIGLELLEDADTLDDLIVPIGGGGLISGIAVAVRALAPHIRIVGVEAAGYASMRDALAGNEGDYGGATIAEGIAVKRPGALTRAIVADLVDDIIVVDEPALEEAVQLLLTTGNVLGEGAGAAGLAALLTAPGRFAGRRVATVICGANIDPRLLSSVLLRGLMREGRLVRLHVEIEDQPGVLGRVAALIGAAGGNIVEVYHHRLVFGMPAKRTDLEIVIETRDRAHVGAIEERIRAAGFGVRRM